MSKIFLKNETVWDKGRLPTEREAMRLLGNYFSEVNPEAAIALSCGIDVKIGGMYFKVELLNDYERIVANGKSNH